PQARGGGREGADGVLAVRFGKHDGFQRTVIDLGTGDQAAWQVPEWNLSSPAGDGLLRVNLPSVDSTQVSDGTFDSSMLKDFHVVRAPEGGMFVDIVSEEAFTYRVLELRKPARLVVDFQPASGANLSTPPPLVDGNTVVTEPRTVTTASETLTVSGYSRNPEASNDIIVVDSTGKEIAREAVRSNDWTQTWGYFETTLEMPAFSGKGKLKVGAASARDGRFEGVRLRLIGGG
ncbi:MAG: Gmad2 immunoglobulin-like domain-containing protein, partial [Actinomycetota bacterium]|nr:Gmad2 immunoglobulin-like domain-containing protein [Actinomycetota bacterium]